MDTYRIRYGLHERDLTIEQIEELWRTCELPMITEIYINWEPGQERWASLAETVALPPREDPQPAQPVRKATPQRTAAPAAATAAASKHDAKVLALVKAGWLITAQLPTGTQLTRKRSKALLGPIVIMIAAIVGGSATQHIDTLYAAIFSGFYLLGLVSLIFRLARSSQEQQFVEKP